MDETDLTEKDHEFIDSEVFQCNTCGWWYEVSEQVGEEGNCQDCEGDEEEEE